MDHTLRMLRSAGGLPYPHRRIPSRLKPTARRANPIPTQAMSIFATRIGNHPAPTGIVRVHEQSQAPNLQRRHPKPGDKITLGVQFPNS